RWPVGAQEDQLVRDGLRRILPDTEHGLQHRVELVSASVDGERRAEQAAGAVVGVGELETELPGRRVQAALVLAAEVEAERRLAGEHRGGEGVAGGWAGRQVPAATARACRQQHSEDASRGQ